MPDLNYDQHFAFVALAQHLISAWDPNEPAVWLPAVWNVLLHAPRAKDVTLAATTFVTLRLARQVAAATNEIRRHDNYRPGRHLHYFGSLSTGRILDWRVAAVLNWMICNSDSPNLRIQEATGPLRLSSSRLRHLLVAQAGYSFGTHISGIRVMRAIDLAATTSLSIKEIAYAVGYCHTSVMDRHFQRWLPVSPSFIRAQACRIPFEPRLFASPLPA